jgi:hypothetical protein
VTSPDIKESESQYEDLFNLRRKNTSFRLIQVIKCKKTKNEGV